HQDRPRLEKNHRRRHLRLERNQDRQDYPHLESRQKSRRNLGVRLHSDLVSPL
ncbi:unnamed protein product, partial [marine sediment metagenome]